MTSMKIVQFSRPSPLCPLSPKFFPPPPSPNHNQSVKRKHNSSITIYNITSFLQVGFRCFQYQFINLAWFSIDFFHLVEANLVPRAIFKNYKTLFRLPLIAKICAGVNLELKPHYLSTFSWHYILVCAVVQKYYEMFFSKVFLVLILQ